MGESRSDADLIRASLEDPEQFAPVFERHYRAVYAYLARRVGPDAGADLASEAFVVAFRKRATFRSEAKSAAPWLMGIAANLARRHARSARRGRRAVRRLSGADVVAWDEDAEPRLDAERLRGALTEAISGLRSQDREILLLYALSDLSYPEIAEALGIPPGTVRSRMFRMRRVIRNHMEHIGQVHVEAIRLPEDHDEPT